MSLVVMLIVSIFVANSHAADAPIQLKIVGGLAGVSQYTRFEAPFWLKTVPQLTQGRVQAEIHPFDQSGLPGQEMLQLMRLGVVPFGTALLAQVSGDEPELNAVDLATLNPDMASLQRTVSLYRDHLHEILLQRYGVELLGVYAYPAQVLFCTRRFTTLKDLAGRKIRTSSVGQSEMMSALGAMPIVLPFSDIVKAVENHVVDCAITGTMSGNEIGLPAVTSYIYPMAISWGLSFFGANKLAWEQLPQDVRDPLRRGIHDLERTIWSAADRETASGLACDIGADTCVGGKIFHMNLVPITPGDNALRSQLLVDTILPKWIKRCGNDCVAAWNETMATALGVQASAE
ncbi:TRAP transporter substrate-binding protein [Rhodopila sp.]|uniref:TRAP transporter substrate-binding protein n=1 Tax=Rhodopila sp. TaxID=2480087 RepID=UPI003D0D2399